jgi:hypothetical protein
MHFRKSASEHLARQWDVVMGAAPLAKITKRKVGLDCPGVNNVEPRQRPARHQIIRL